MKTLIDGAEVFSRIYYYLLDFNEMDNKNYLINVLNKDRLCDLNIEEFRLLFEYATEIDKLTL